MYKGTLKTLFDTSRITIYDAPTIYGLTVRDTLHVYVGLSEQGYVYTTSSKKIEVVVNMK